ncbi:hypothetical protein [Paracoccus aerodenitrificans]|uniref:hypothetical protein n=1 Tax=Paracoccus aerodenitrificans TaxID=3017781 RepID=UPI0022F04309|nr:hypothetical protein [Paracoccus aerodenitrificans]WBU64579.1 hypothetical protein PAE61_03805 [Paracoccus aerodenitrificans]
MFNKEERRRYSDQVSLRCALPPAGHDWLNADRYNVRTYNLMRRGSFSTNSILLKDAFRIGQAPPISRSAGPEAS